MPYKDYQKHIEHGRQYYQKNKEKAREYHRKTYLENKEQIKEKARQYYNKNKKEISRRGKELYQKTGGLNERRTRLKSTYGISIEEYNSFLMKQHNLCAICNGHEIILYRKGGKIRNFAVDHDHQTGRIRGLLCQSCNMALGGFKDNIEILYNAIKYLTI